MHRPSVTFVSFLSIFFVYLSLVTGHGTPSIDVIPSTPVNESITAQFVSQKNTFDAPHLSAVNSSVFEWWYFDFTTLDLSTAIVVVFFTSTPNGFPLLEGMPSDVSISAEVMLPNGTVLSTAGPASKAIIASHGALGEGVDAYFDPVGAFAGSPDLNYFALDVDTSQEPGGFSLEMSFQSIAPAHNPCSAILGEGQPLQVMPHFGWTNAVPDSSTSASLTLSDGSTQIFTGSGYHDHNWGDIPFPEILSEWYWGRGRVGPFSFTFSKGSDFAHTPFAVGYVAENGEILASSCQASETLLTPTNGPGGDGDLEILAVEIFIDSKTTLGLQIGVQAIISEAPGAYYRWTGNVTGGIQGQQQYDGGVGFVERFLPVN